MKTKFIVLLSIIGLSLIVSVSAFLMSNSGASKSPPSGEITCEVLQENPGGINLVYFASKDDAKKYTDYFLSVEPFSKHKDKFSFYYISPESYRAECELYQGIAILCHSSELVKAASACPNDYIVVLEEKPSSIRSSAFRGVMSLNTNHPLSVFAHEFYHVFDNGAEEYVSPGTSVPRGSENCQDSCESFREFPGHSGELGCHGGCTSSELFREFENGFMKSLHTNSYGPHNILILEEEVLNQYDGGGSVTGNVILEEDKGEFIIVEGTPERGFKTEKVKGFVPGGKKFGEYNYSVRDVEGNVIFEGNVGQEVIFNTDFSEGDITSPPLDNELPLLLTAPFTGREDVVRIEDNGETVAEVELKGVGARPCKA